VLLMVAAWFWAPSRGTALGASSSSRGSSASDAGAVIKRS
jgi:hypothetical protein